MPNIIVTGGSRGIGLAIVRRLAANNANVIAIARRASDQLSSAIAKAKAEGSGAIHFRAFDLAATAGLRNLIKDLRKHFGPITGLVNNAALGTGGLLATMHDANIDRLIHLNVTAPILLTKYVVRAMMADGGGGRIVNIASIVGFTGFKGLSAYAATKSSIIGFTRSLAREVGTLGITVNAIAPGFIATEMTQELDPEQRAKIAHRSALGHMAEPDDIAGAVEFLLGPNARNITGIVLTVDAGATA